MFYFTSDIRSNPVSQNKLYVSVYRDFNKQKHLVTYLCVFTGFCNVCFRDTV